ncbi:DUF4337 family protein [Paraburkholderia sp. GAS334]|uniref:DUF4337 family protein n=1 Tax=Paraburkholderia sp. GAS334 TaxID=3035131 RepID=UPI003D225995
MRPAEFEIHGPHDSAVEHASHGDSFSARIAVMTAILATLGAFGSYQSGTTENLALIAKNEAAISKTKAAKQWGYFHAKGEKKNLAELGAAIVDPKPQCKISIALAAITLLTRKRWLQVMSLGVAVCGASLGVAALLSW